VEQQQLEPAISWLALEEGIMQAQNTETKQQEVIASHEARDLIAILLKHHGIHDGLFDLAVEFQIGVGAVGPDAASSAPGVAIGVRRIGLMPAKQCGPNTVNAAEANPAPVKKSPAKKAAA
jgi:hypothetical protein